MADAQHLARRGAEAAGEHHAEDPWRAATTQSVSVTPSGTRTAVVVGEAMLSVFAQSCSPIALTPARVAAAVRAWRCQTFSGPSSRY